MECRLRGKVAVVSGGSRGIGRAIATMLVGEGVRVVIASRGGDSQREAVADLERLAPGKVAAVAADMTTSEGVDLAVRTACERFGPPLIAVSNVIGHVIHADQEGEGPGAGTFASIAAGDHRHEFERLFYSAWLLAQRCLPDMRAAQWGRICNIGSMVAREPLTGLPHVLPNSVRPAVAGYHRMLAAHVAPDGITVNNILTGGILTERNRSYWNWLAAERGQTFDEVLADFTRDIPLRRQGEPEELAALVTFLCSEQAGRITGQSISVEGGASRHL